MDYTDKAMIEAARQFRDKGYIWGYELLLPREVALELIDFLEQHDMLVVGCNLWQFWAKDRTKFVEIPAGGAVVEQHLSDTDMAHNARVLKEFLQKPLPFEADFISFDFDDPAVWDWLVPPEEQYPHGRTTDKTEKMTKTKDGNQENGG